MSCLTGFFCNWPRNINAGNHLYSRTDKTPLILLQNVARIVFLHFFSALIFFFSVYTSLITSARGFLCLM
ncbi:hypothetical protein FNN14_12970 [Cronobacter sakazakii]|nr:hypothetical protein FNN14_12970 [Cronobacter sakazakii]